MVKCHFRILSVVAQPMTYQVLARKWRPRNFSEMVGQEHVLKALINALDHDRLHHAFLFAGTRGVGKTTIARILAKSLNCEQGVSSKPCGQCSACTEIDAGRFVDLIEVDAASRTKVDDTRELLDNVQYTPTRGRYKVYLIDEVHMLSTHSFNALLKTLEEPPPHVKFLLATTDPQKLPVTILSRCLQFNLKRLPAALIEEHMTHILAAEKVRAEAAAVQQVARAADGSMRDALSLLDQAIAFGGGALTESEVRVMLGTVEQRYIVGLLQALAASDGNALMEQVADLDTQAPDYTGVLDDLAAALQRIAVQQVLGSGPDAAAELAELADTFSPEDVQLYYQIALLGKRDLPLAPEPRAGFEMVLLRMLAFRPASDETARQAAPAARPVARSNTRNTPVTKPATAVPASQPDVVSQAAAVPTPTPTGNWQDPDWVALVDGLGLRGMTQQLAANCTYLRRDGMTLLLQLGEEERQLLTERTQTQLQQALEKFYREPLKLKIELGAVTGETSAQRDARREAARQQAAETSIEQDPAVQAMREAFGARVDENSVRPLD